MIGNNNESNYRYIYHKNNQSDKHSVPICKRKSYQPEEISPIYIKDKASVKEIHPFDLKASTILPDPTVRQIKRLTEYSSKKYYTIGTGYKSRYGKKLDTQVCLTLALNNDEEPLDALNRLLYKKLDCKLIDNPEIDIVENEYEDFPNPHLNWTIFTISDSQIEPIDNQNYYNNFDYLTSEKQTSDNRISLIIVSMNPINFLNKLNIDNISDRSSIIYITAVELNDAIKISEITSSRVEFKYKEYIQRNKGNNNDKIEFKYDSVHPFCKFGESCDYFWSNNGCRNHHIDESNGKYDNVERF